jgi:uncharacterized protein (TIGR02145 family)
MKTKIILLFILNLHFTNILLAECNCNNYLFTATSTCSSISVRVGYTIIQTFPSLNCQLGFLPRTFRIDIDETDNPFSIPITHNNIVITNSIKLITDIFNGLNPNTNYTVTISIKGGCPIIWSDAVKILYIKTGGGCSNQTTTANDLNLITCNSFIASWPSNPCASNYQLKMWNTQTNYYYDNGTIHTGSNFKFYGGNNNPLPQGNYAFQYRFSYKTCVSGVLTTVYTNWSTIKTCSISGSSSPIIYTQTQTLHPCSSSVVLSANSISGGYWTVNPSNGGTFSNIYSPNATFTINANQTNVILTWNGPCPTNKANITITNGFTCGNDYTDTRDNKIYPTIYIGNQCWFKKNLNYTNTNNTAGFEYFSLSSTVLGTSKVYKYCYDNSLNNCSTYGALYSGTTARMNNVCPACWRVPTGEPQSLSDYQLLVNNYSSPSLAALALEDANNYNSHMNVGGLKNPGYIYLGLNSIQYYPPSMFCGTNPRCFVYNNLFSKNTTYYWSQSVNIPQANPPYTSFANWGAQFHGPNSGMSMGHTIFLFVGGIEEEASYIRCIKVKY